MKNICIILLSLTLAACTLPGQRPDNSRPMYGGIESTGKYKAADERFIGECIDTYGSLDSAAKAHAEMGWQYFHFKRDTTTAIKRFNQAWLLDSTLSEAYFGFAAICAARGESEAADGFYALGEQKSANKAHTVKYYLRAMNSLLDVGKTDEAFVVYDKITTLAPDSADVYTWAGYMFFEAGLTEAAQEADEKAMTLAPNDFAPYINRGWSHQTQGRYEEALADYSQAVKLAPQVIKGRANRGLLLIELGRYAEAKADLEECVRLDPDSGELWRYLGVAEYRLGNTDKARLTLLAAANFGDKHAEELIKEFGL